MAKFDRDYTALIAAAMPPTSGESRGGAMKRVIDLLWSNLHAQGVSWIGFYIDQPGEPDDRRLVLGPCRDRPACSPIGLHGVCGQALLSQQTRIIDDVASLGENYIACDPRDRSEIVVPLIDAAGACWGVLDVDSFDVGVFNAADEAGLRAVLVAAGLLPSKQTGRPGATRV